MRVIRSWLLVSGGAPIQSLAGGGITKSGQFASGCNRTEPQDRFFFITLSGNYPWIQLQRKRWQGPVAAVSKGVPAGAIKNKGPGDDWFQPLWHWLLWNQNFRIWAYIWLSDCCSSCHYHHHHHRHFISKGTDALDCKAVAYCSLIRSESQKY